MRSARLFFGCLSLSVLFLACDTAQPEKTGLLVIEAYFKTDRPLPRIMVHESGPIDALLNEVKLPVVDASVVVKHNDTDISFVPVLDSPGVYKAPDGNDFILRALDRISVRVISQSRMAEGSGMIPPSVSITNVNVFAPDRAIEAVLIDSLNLGIDSLNVSIIANEGFIYPVEVELTWQVPQGIQDADDFWIQTRLDPINKFSSSLLDFFLLSEQVLAEYDIEIGDDPVFGRIRKWTGIYAVPVQNEEDELPQHDLRITLLRSGSDYARLVTTAREPERRSPAGNVTGGIGFIGGISVDSLTISIGQ
ncbi:MAG: DUF4249 family protein [Bacteroidetes bacterium]|nr:MAG: DUF4249 family protein [Bacteroidota bacterium]